MRRYFLKTDQVRVLFSFLLIIALVTSAASVVFYRQAQMYKGTLDNVYAKSFYDLVDGVYSLEGKLTKLQISQSKGQELKLLESISMQTQLVRDNLAQIPLKNEASEPTIKFINQMGDYAQVLHSSLSEGKPIGAEDRSQLSALLTRCTQLQRQLSTLAVEGGSPWDVTAKPIEGGPAALSEIHNTGADYPTLTYDGPFSDGSRGQMRALPTNEVDEMQAADIVREFVGREQVTSITPTGATYEDPPCWGFDITTQDRGDLSLMITQQGGKVLFMMGISPLQKGTQSTIEECVSAAKEFLLVRGFGSMQESYTQQYEGVVVISFIAKQDDVLLYPDLVKVQVARVGTNVIGLEARNYFTNHVQRELKEPLITPEQAKDIVSGNLIIQRTRLCVIPMDMREVFCYELTGDLQGNTFLIYIDAITGEEANILRIIDEEGGQLAV